MTDALIEFFPYLTPEAILVAAATLIFLGGTLRSNRNLWGSLSLLAIVIAGCVVAVQGRPLATRSATFAAPVVFDNLGWLVRVVSLGAGAILVLFSWNEVPDRQAADHQACLLIITAGLSLTGLANDLVTLFLSLEFISIPTYVLLYLPRHDESAQEAALKYFLLSIFSSGLLLFGFSYLYGTTGTTNVSAIVHTLFHTEARTMPPLTVVALIMVVAGLGARITAVPFHFYAPDVYQGAPPVGGALLAFVPKASGFIALLRVLGFIVPGIVAGDLARDQLPFFIGMALSEQTPIVLWFLAAITMTLGNFLGLWQENVKRLLAYSSIAHAGYMLLALSVAPYLRPASMAQAAEGPDGIEALLFYLVAYGAMTIGAFAVLSYLSTPERPIETLDDLAGLSQSHPGIALFMLLFLFSLIGIPLTAGFTGKLLIFFGAMGVSGNAASLFRVLAVIGMLNAAIGAWYYLRIVAVMYLRNSLRPVEKKGSWPGLATLWLCALLTLGLGLSPGGDWLLRAARQAAGTGTQPPLALFTDEHASSPK
jgi:NADH-quinone oxidoreductase subunit N